MSKPITLTVQEVGNDTIKTKTSDGQVWMIPKTAILGTVKSGQELRFIAVSPGSEDAGKTALAHTLLNELLGISSLT